MALLTEKSKTILNDLFQNTGLKKTLILERALIREKKNFRIKQLNDYYANLKKDKESWKEEIENREELANSLKDGFDD